MIHLSVGYRTLQWMLDHNLPLTREIYLDLAYPHNVPEEWTAEHEIDLPEPFQRPGPDYVD